MSEHKKDDNKVSQRFDDAFASEFNPLEQENGSSNQKSALENEIESLKKELAEAQEKVSNHWERLVRKEADLQNTQRIATQESEKARKFAIKSFAGELLEVLDSLEQGLGFTENGQTSVEHLREGMKMTQSVLQNALQKHGVTPVAPEVGDAFDPTYHQALATQETNEMEPNRIMAVIQKGYMLHHQLLRPARVLVSKEVGT